MNCARYASRTWPLIRMQNTGTRLRKRVLLIAALCVSFTYPIWSQDRPKADEPPKAVLPQFTDVTSALGLHFQNLASHTLRKYLPETMGGGVALFDFDNDGRLDIFAVNGAPLTDPTPKGTIPQKTDPKYWNRLYHQKQDGTFEDVTEKAGLQGTG